MKKRGCFQRPWINGELSVHITWTYKGVLPLQRREDTPSQEEVRGGQYISINNPTKMNGEHQFFESCLLNSLFLGLLHELFRGEVDKRANTF